MKQTYYMVQTGPNAYVNDPTPTCAFGTARTPARMSLANARRAYRDECAQLRHDTPTRFPRIIKVSVETKTIKDRR